MRLHEHDGSTRCGEGVELPRRRVDENDDGADASTAQNFRNPIDIGVVRQGEYDIHARRCCLPADAREHEIRPGAFEVRHDQVDDIGTNDLVRGTIRLAA